MWFTELSKSHRRLVISQVACDTPSRGDAQREITQNRSEKKEEQTKESGLSFDPNIRLGPKLNPNVPLYTLEAIRKFLKR